MDETTRKAKVIADVAALWRARNTLLWVVSREESRVENALTDAAVIAKFVSEDEQIGIRFWDCATGITRMRDGKVETLSQVTDPLKALDAIRESKDRSIFVLRDFHKWLNDPFILRGIRSLARELQSVPPRQTRLLVILAPTADVPPELSSHTTVIDFPIPDRAEMGAILDEVITSLPPNLAAGAPTNGAREAVIDAAIGLSREETMNCLTRSLVTSRKIDPVLVASEKKRIVARERVLTWHDPDPRGLAAIGGLDLMKTWLEQRKLAFGVKARAYGLPPPKGVLLVGLPGCLTGDTIINVHRKQSAGGHKGIRLDALFYKFNGRHEEGARLGLYGDSKKWDLTHPTKAHCYLEDQKYIGFNEIEGVVYSGVKEVYRLTTDHGAEIKATADHKFLTTRGFVRLGDLRPGDELFAHREGVLADDNSTGRNRNKALRQINNVGNHPFARRRTVNGLDYSAHPLHRLVVEADMNGMRLEEFLWALHGDTSALEFLSEDVEVHHKDEDRDNNTLSNLERMSKAEHARHHLNERGILGRWRYAPRLQKVAKIDRVGKMPTYDIQMKDPHNNFIANGLVVHNSGKSLTAKAVSTAFECPLLRLDMGALRSKWVGESEANIRKALQVAEAIGKSVLWIDEIEKALSGSTGPQGDGGVAADALGTVLNWMQERQGEVFIVATANDVRILPPELLRKGRFDEIFWSDLPTSKERAQIIKAALAQYKVTNLELTGDQLDFVVQATDKFTGAEIASIIPEAMFTAFADKERPISVSDLLRAAETVVPLAKTANEKIEALRAWAKDKARPASSPEATAKASRVANIDLD